MFPFPLKVSVDTVAMKEAHLPDDDPIERLMSDFGDRI